MIQLTDFPKLHCPFVRKTFKVDKDDWYAAGKALGLRVPEVRLAIDEVNPGYEWVFEDKDTFAVEKLDGTNVKVLTKDGCIVSVYNRKNPIDLLKLSSVKGKLAIVEGVFRAAAKNYIEPDGEQAGEILGPTVNGNIYRLSSYIWYPFEKAISGLKYNSFHQHDRTYANWSSWFKHYLTSRFAGKMGNKIMAEGVVFYNLRRKEDGQIYRAKLRRNMFEWYYSDKIKIHFD